MTRTPKLQITDDLRLSIGDTAVQLTPSRGLDFAERLGRVSFRRALADEALAVERKPRAARKAVRA